MLLQGYIIRKCCNLNSWALQYHLIPEKMLAEPIFCNKNIEIGNKVIFYKKFEEFC